MDTVEQGERVEAELDRIIEKRDAERRATEGEGEREQLWQESVRRYKARRGEEHRAAWYEHEMRLFRIHSGLASEHLARAVFNISGFLRFSQVFRDPKRGAAIREFLAFLEVLKKGLSALLVSP